MTTQEEYYEKYLRKKYNKRYSAGRRYFTVFRVGEKFKNDPAADTVTIEGLKKFDIHTNRKKEIANADPSKKHLNRILIGSENVVEDVKMYLEGVKISKNSVVAREIILSAGNGFMDNMIPQDKEKWIETNVKFIKDNFGDNCVYAALHLDKNLSLHMVTYERKCFKLLGSPYNDVDIEIQGEHHYEDSYYASAIEHDKLKKEYCLKNGIKLFEIEYFSSRTSLNKAKEKVKEEINKIIKDVYF